MIKRHPALGWINRADSWIWMGTCICGWETGWMTKARMRKAWKIHKET